MCGTSRVIRLHVVTFQAKNFSFVKVTEASRTGWVYAFGEHWVTSRSSCESPKRRGIYDANGSDVHPFPCLFKRISFPPSNPLFWKNCCRCILGACCAASRLDPL